MKPDVRAIACSILNKVDQPRHTLDRVVADVLTVELLPDKRDRALVTTLVYGVLRWRRPLDWLINHFSKTPFDKIELEILNILRSALFQIKYLDRIPDFAAVDSAVNLAKESASPRAVGFVNGLLRNVIRNSSELNLPDAEKYPARSLALAQSFPKWLVKRWLASYGLEETRLICGQINEIPPITVRVNTLVADRESVRKSLAAEVARVEDEICAGQALRLYSPSVSVAELTAFKQGQIQVQDEAAQLVCQLLEPQPGDKILDACAGLGGKTGALGQLLGNSGHILAVDINPEKLHQLEVEMARLGISNVETKVIDLENSSAVDALGRFDRILADCPCSGLGVLRRNPDTKWSVRPEDLPRHHQFQVGLLNNLAPLVRPGGILMYVVCSREPEENEQVIDSFLNLQKEFEIDHIENIESCSAFNFISERGCFETLPHPHQMDGFFGVRLKRVG